MMLQQALSPETEGIYLCGLLQRKTAFKKLLSTANLEDHHLCLPHTPLTSLSINGEYQQNMEYARMKGLSQQMRPKWHKGELCRRQLSKKTNKATIQDRRNNTREWLRKAYRVI